MKTVVSYMHLYISSEPIARQKVGSFDFPVLICLILGHIIVFHLLFSGSIRRYK